MNWRDDYLAIRTVPGAGECGLLRYAFTWGLVTGLRDTGYIGRYCFEHHADAWHALVTWNGRDGDPPGPWIKYKGIGGERLGPGALKETV